MEAGKGEGRQNKYEYRTMYLWCVYILFVNAVCLIFAVVYTGRETSPKELYALTALIAVPLFYFGGAGSAVFWIIGACIYMIVYFILSIMSLGREGGIDSCTVMYL